MHSLIKNESFSAPTTRLGSNISNAEVVVSNILDIIKLQQDNLPISIESSEKFAKAKVKVLKQLPNMYKNTRLTKYLIQNSPTSSKIEYKKIKGLMLNIQKRMCWYLNIEEEKTKCLLISTKAKTSNEDLVQDTPRKYFFEYYAKFIVTEGDERKFISIPLVDLNISVV
jgi:hypothetical protein